MALFHQRKSSCHRLITLSFSLLRRGCSLGQCSLSLAYFLTGGVARYVTVRSPSVDLDCSVCWMIRKKAMLLALGHAAPLGLGFLPVGTCNADARLRPRSAPGPPRSSAPS